MPIAQLVEEKRRLEEAWRVARHPENRETLRLRRGSPAGSAARVQCDGAVDGCPPLLQSVFDRCTFYVRGQRAGNLTRMSLSLTPTYTPPFMLRLLLSLILGALYRPCSTKGNNRALASS